LGCEIQPSLPAVCLGTARQKSQHLLILSHPGVQKAVLRKIIFSNESRVVNSAIRADRRW